MAVRKRGPVGFWFRLVVALLRPWLMILTKRDWRGQRHLPQSGGVVVVGNHVSHLDPLTFAHYIWDNGRVPRYLAKEAVFRVPVVGYIIAKCGQIPVYRESRNAAHAFRDAVAAVEAGECVVIYPEGTLTRDPDLWPMVGKTGAARVALQTGCPVVPIAQWGAQEILAPYATRFRIFPRKTIRMQAGPPVDLGDLRGQAVTPEILHAATDRIMAALTRELEQLRDQQAPAVRFDPRVAGVPVTGNPRKAASRKKEV